MLLSHKNGHDLGFLATLGYPKLEVKLKEVVSSCILA